MATYTPTGNPEILNKVYSGSTVVNIQEFVSRYQEIKENYQKMLATTKAQATILYQDLKPIKDAGLLPAKYDAGFAELEAFVS